MKIAEWFHDDRKYGIVVSGAAAVYAVFDTVRTGNYLEHGWVHPLLIGGILAGVFCAGLIFRQEWSRWVGFLLLGAGVALVLWHTYQHGISLARVATLVGSPFLLWYLATLPITRVQKLLNDPDFMSHVRRGADEMRRRLESQDRWKIVVLFRDTIQLDAECLSRIAQRTFGGSFAVINRKIAAVDASLLPSKRSDPVIAGIPPVLVCYSPPHLLGVYVGASQHPDLVDDHDAHNATHHDSADEHRAWVEVEVLPYVDNIQPVENGYKYSGKLAAELINEQCVGIYLPERDRVFPMSSELPDALRSPDPSSALNL